ncbi:hypothetical protein PHAVU_010G064500 [Phaseolus vulgaris]|uniref:Uncharacterized protein n=1 Tax=Phaseolus vulgaris TaxID=3885 RepID=V7APX4_PHAVU|nr:hypothetical protein PHAVU_010G064500g [Phaseolus vulgaris]ESW06638.1 hypothetical protein PHAVU_010G064500g [Phaseolus vulgaris]
MDIVSDNLLHAHPIQRLSYSFQRLLFSRFTFRYPLESLWPRGNNSKHEELALDNAVLADNAKAKAVRDDDEGDISKRRNWVLKILHVKSVWEGKQRGEGEVAVTDQTQSNYDGEEVCECDACGVEEDDDYDTVEAEFDRGSFSRMLRRVSLAESRLYA